MTGNDITTPSHPTLARPASRRETWYCADSTSHTGRPIIAPNPSQRDHAPLVGRSTSRISVGAVIVKPSSEVPRTKRSPSDNDECANPCVLCARQQMSYTMSDLIYYLGLNKQKAPLSQLLSLTYQLSRQEFDLVLSPTRFESIVRAKYRDRNKSEIVIRKILNTRTVLAREIQTDVELPNENTDRRWSPMKGVGKMDSSSPNVVESELSTVMREVEEESGLQYGTDYRIISGTPIEIVDMCLVNNFLNVIRLFIGVLGSVYTGLSPKDVLSSVDVNDIQHISSFVDIANADFTKETDAIAWIPLSEFDRYLPECYASTLVRELRSRLSTLYDGRDIELHLSSGSHGFPLMPTPPHRPLYGNYEGHQTSLRDLLRLRNGGQTTRPGILRLPSIGASLYAMGPKRRVTDVIAQGTVSPVVWSAYARPPSLSHPPSPILINTQHPFRTV